MTALTALGPVWVALFAFVIGEWAWHFVRIKRLLRDPPPDVAERMAALDGAAASLEAIPGRAMLYGILGTAVGMVQALGAIRADAAAAEVVASLLGPGAGTTLALVSTAVGLVIADVTSRFSRPVLSRVDAALWALEHVSEEEAHAAAK